MSWENFEKDRAEIASLYVDRKWDADSGITDKELLAECLAIEKEHVNGFIPVSDEGKRFISLTSANKLGVSQSFLAQHELNLLDVDVDFNGKICDIREWNGD